MYLRYSYLRVTARTVYIIFLSCILGSGPIQNVVLYNCELCTTLVMAFGIGNQILA